MRKPPEPFCLVEGETLPLYQKFTKKCPLGTSGVLVPAGHVWSTEAYFPGVETGFFSGVDFTLPFTGAVVLPGEATGDGDVAGVDAGVAVATGVAVAVGLTLFVPLLAGLLLQAPRAAVAARTELIINDLLIFLLVPSLG